MSQRAPETIFHRKGWLAAQPEAFREAWLAVAEARPLRRGERLYSLGDPPGGIYGIAHGFADVLMASGYVTPVLAHIARPGWWVGEAAAVTGSPRRVEICARTDVKVLYIPPQALDVLEPRFPYLWRALAQLTVLHLDNAMMYAAALLKGDATARIASTLVRLAGPEMACDADIAIPCTQHDLGEMAGLSRNSAGPAVKRLEGAGLVSRAVCGEIRFNPVRLAHAAEAQLSRSPG